MEEKRAERRRGRRKKSPASLDAAQALGKRLELLTQHLKEKGVIKNKVEMAQLLQDERGDSFRLYCDGKRDPGAWRLMMLKQALPELNLNWLLAGEGPMFEATESVPFYKDAPVSAGGGAFPAEVEAHPIRASKEFLHRFFGFSRGLMLIPVWGDSMEPTLKDGSIAIVRKAEHEGNEIRDGHIYVFRYQGEVFIKRLRRRIKDGEVWLVASSDNEAYEPFEIPLSRIERGETQEDFALIGRVVGLLASEAQILSQKP